jgi:CheY-like chemotaxis protein
MAASDPMIMGWSQRETSGSGLPVTGPWPNRCVLVVEDDTDVRETLADLLEAEGYQVARAANGRQALDYLQRARPPGLILLDLIMPVMDGHQFRQRQRQDPVLASVPTAVVSAFRPNSDQMAALEPAGWLVKPVDLKALLDIVQRHCGPAHSDTHGWE